MIEIHPLDCGPLGAWTARLLLLGARDPCCGPHANVRYHKLLSWVTNRFQVPKLLSGTQDHCVVLEIRFLQPLSDARKFMAR